MRSRAFVIAGSAAAALLPSIAYAAEGGAEGQTSWLTLLLFIINFSLFVAFLVYFAAPMARRFFSDRAAGIHSNLERLQSALKEAEEYERRVAARIARLEDDLKSLMEEIEAETAVQVGRIRSSSREVVERIKRDAEMTAAALAESARRRLRGRVAGMAAHFARELISRAVGPADQNRLIDGFTEKLHQEAAR